MITYAHRLNDLAASPQPWYKFAADKCLESWHEHFRPRNIPHIVWKTRHGQQLWVRYRYDYSASIHSAKNHTYRRKEDVPPGDMLEALR